MSYPAGEALILTALREKSGYAENNTNRGNWQVLNSGKSAYYVVLRMGPATNEQHAMSAALTVWRTQLMVYQRYKDDGTTAVNLQARMQEIIEHMEQYAQLSDTTDTVVDAQIVNISEMQEIQMNELGPVYLLSIIDMDWQEVRNITYI